VNYRQALNLLKSEVDRVMALLGCNSTEQLGPEYLRIDPDWHGARLLKQGMRDEGRGMSGDAKSA
jgi:hypothetical protein